MKDQKQTMKMSYWQLLFKAHKEEVLEAQRIHLQLQYSTWVYMLYLLLPSLLIILVSKKLTNVLSGP